MIEIRNVSRVFGRRRALDNVSLAVPAGQVTLLLGANGAGKSTLFRCVLGLIGFDGQVRVDGIDPLADGVGVRSRIGYMPQSGALHPDLTVGETIAFYANVRGVARDRGVTLLIEAGLGDETGSRVGDLSGGMRQRLGFAIALLTNPTVLLLDEPSSSLDAASRKWLARMLRQVASEGRTVLVSTHSGQELFEAGDCFITLEEGRVVCCEPAPAPSPKSPAPAAMQPSPAASRRGSAKPIVVKELRDALHNRWLAGFAALLGVLGLVATASAYDSLTGFTIASFGRTTATLMNLCLLLAPLVAVVMGASAIAGEQERGTLEPLLAQPLTRTQLLLSKHAGLLLALAGAILAGFFPAGVLIAARSGPAMLAHYLLFPLLAILTAAAMAGIGVFISVTSRSAAQALGTAIGAWFSLALLYDLVLIGSLSVGGLPVEVLGAALLMNPIDAARVLGILALEPDLYLLGPAGAYLTAQLSSLGAAVVLVGAIVCWATVPLLAAALKFSLPLRRKHSHETNRMGAAAGIKRPRRSYRLRVGRVGF